MKKKNIILLIVVVIIISSIWYINTNNTRSLGQNTEVTENETGEALPSELLAGNMDSNPLWAFSQETYNDALESDKLIVLYFYANWCPTCRKEFPVMQQAFNDLEGSDVVGFRVNYKDLATDENEEAVAREFGIGYQHTKVFVKDGEQILKAPDTWDYDRYIEEINNHL